MYVYRERVYTPEFEMPITHVLNPIMYHNSTQYPPC